MSNLIAKFDENLNNLLILFKLLVFRGSVMLPKPSSTKGWVGTTFLRFSIFGHPHGLCK